MINFEILGDKNICIIGRDEHKQRYRQIVEDFQPYFYDDLKTKVIVDRPGDVPAERDKYPRTFESDIPYIQRFIIDRLQLPLAEEPIRICTFDIETNISLDTENVPEPITCIGLFDNFMNKAIAFVWRKDLKKEVKHITGYKVYNWEVDLSIRYYNTEKDMIDDFLKFIKQTDPDIIAGYNVEDFDLNYLINRCKKIYCNFTQLSAFGRVSNEKKRVRIMGKTIFDIKEGYKSLQKGGAEAKLSGGYSLENVAQYELGVTKKDIDMEKAWTENIEQLIDYNITDVILTVKVDELKNIIRAHDVFRRYAGCTWDGIFWNSYRCDALVLRESKKRGIILPRAPKRPKKGEITEEELIEENGKKKEKFSGGYVMDTKPGVHKNVIILDLASLYPSIIQQFNISFDTISKDGTIRIKTEITNKKGEKRLFDASYVDKPIGVIPAILETQLIIREKYKAEKKKYPRGSKEWIAYDTLQFGAKVNRNALYGFLGYKYARIFNEQVAESVTVMGREIINWSKDIVKNMGLGLDVIYADTDSLFIETQYENINDAVKIKEQILTTLNNSYSEFVKKFGCPENKYIRIEFKGIYSSLAFTTAKKRYVGWLVYSGDEFIKPEFEITGFEMKRSDFSIAGKEIQEYIWKQILELKTKKEIDQIVKEKKLELMKITDMRKIAMPKTVTRNLDRYATKQSFLRGCDLANYYLGESIRGGTPIKYIYIRRFKAKNGNWIVSDVISYTMKPPEVEIDWNKMLEITIDNKIEKIYEAMGWDQTNKGFATSLLDFKVSK